MKITFSEFAKILSEPLGCKNQADFTSELLENIVQAPKEEDQKKEKDSNKKHHKVNLSGAESSDNQSSNIIIEISPETLRKYYSGERGLSYLAKEILPYLDTKRFEGYIHKKLAFMEPDDIDKLFDGLSPYCMEKLDAEVGIDQSCFIIANLFKDIILNATKTRKKRTPTCKLSLIDNNFSYPPHYIDTLEEIEKIYNSFDNNSQFQYIHGSHGSGKTELAHAFANTAREKNWFKHVLFTSYNHSLKDTIASLKTTGASREGFNEKIALLNDLQKKGRTLIIIDNYYNEAYNDELSVKTAEYEKLLKTECSVLFTSTINIGMRNEMLPREKESLPTDKLITLFYNVKGNKNDSDKDVKELIETYLSNNVHLVIHSGLLAEQGLTAKDIMHAFDSQTISDNTELVSWVKNEVPEEDKTMYEHFCIMVEGNKLIHPDDANARENVYKVLSLLSLLPIGGIREKDFFNYAFDSSFRTEARKIAKNLERHYLVFVKNENIYLHPLFREYIFHALKMKEEYVFYFIKQLCDLLNLESYKDNFMYWLSTGREVHNVLKMHSKNADFSKEFNFYTTVLGAYLSSLFDIIKNTDLAYKYGIEAKNLLAKYDWQNEDTQTKYVLASSLNSIGYTFIHQKSDNEFKRENDRKWAQDAFETAKVILLSLDTEDINIAVLLTKVHGNLGSCELDRKNYEKALEMHALALEERNTFWEKGVPADQINFLIATSYRCLGTDWFYLRKYDGYDPIDCLVSSYKHNRESVKIFEKVCTKNHLETTISCNRLIGTSLTLISALNNDQLLEEKIGKTFDELIADIYSFIDSSIDFLSSLKHPIETEIKDCLNNLKNISQLLASRGLLNDKKIAFNKKVVEKIKFSNLSSETYELLNSLPIGENNV